MSTSSSGGAHDQVAEVSEHERYDALDRPAGDELDAVVRAAAVVAGVPTATLNLFDGTRMCQVSTVGFRGVDSPLSESMCHLAVGSGEPLVHLPDARLVPEYAATPWVDGRAARVRFYASVPLTAPDGHVLGALCVFDTEPGRLDERQADALRGLAAVVVALLERRRDARRGAELAALAEERRVLAATLLDTVDVGIVACDADGHLTLFNRTARAWHGVDADPGAEPADLPVRYDLRTADGGAALAPRDVPLLRALRGGPVDRFPFVIAAPGRPARHVEATARPLRRADGTVGGAVVAMTDVSGHHRAAARAAAALERHEALVRAQSRLAEEQQVPAAVAARTCSAAREVVGAAGAAVLEPAAASTGGVAGGEADRWVVRAATGDLAALDGSPLALAVPGRAAAPAGTGGPADGCAVVPLRHRGRLRGALLVAPGADGLDQGDLAALEVLAVPAAAALVNARTLQEVRRTAAHDALTGLPNRAALLQALQEGLRRQERTGTHLAVLFLDLDGFKAVNDDLGHRAGDDLLVAVAARLRAVLRTTDTPARWGGDEFVVLAEGLAVPADAHLLAARVAEAVAGEHAVRGPDGTARTVRIGTSAGVALAAPGPVAGDGAERAAQLVTAADDAMYEDKQARRRARADEVPGVPGERSGARAQASGLPPVTPRTSEVM
ncbi:diguanylate cyclase domain-containing protein [Kineococcus sp. SYSU DK004]|uniref:diguanylate cyclase domain-containing protein n=1 Tax=Kineococcus sp. SYSU DK004 TaxID=3383125 RepID=UPI003D7E5F53